MKISKIIDMTFMVLVFLMAYSLTYYVYYKANKKTRTYKAGLSKSSVNIVQGCLYNSTLAKDKDSLCYRLLNPSLHDNFSTFSPRELPLRHAFYIEAAVLNKMFAKWSDCRMRLTYLYKKDLCKPTLSEYKGHFKQDFKTDKYDIFSHFWYGFRYANPLESAFFHCMHFHASNKNKLSPKSKKCSPYVDINYDNVLETYPRMSYYWGKWLQPKTFARMGLAYPPKDATERKILAIAKMAYSCLYSGNFRGGIEAQTCISNVNQEITVLASNFSSNGSVVFPALNSLSISYIRLVRTNLVYDCLRYHRHERVHWCEGVREQVIRLSASPAGNRSELEDDVTFTRDYILEVVKPFEDAAWEEAATKSPFKILPTRLMELCAWYTLDGKTVDARPLACEKGGLYYHFL